MRKEGGGRAAAMRCQCASCLALHPDLAQRQSAPSLPRWVDGQNLGDLIQGFDQEAAAVVMARLVSFKMEAEDDFDATRWLDR